MPGSLFERQVFSPSCPAGGTWWSCGYGTFFVGCCARDPCEITCAQGNLYPGAFDPTSYGDFPDATCGTGSKFYTCAAGKTFWGCCKTNACAQSGCPDGDLEPAILNRDDLLSAYHATGGLKTDSSPSPTSASNNYASVTLANVATTSATSTSSTISPSNTASVATEETLPVAAIAGGAAGGTFALAIISGFVIWFLCSRKRKAKTREKEDGAEQSLDILPICVMAENRQPEQTEAPPSYTPPTPGVNNTIYSPLSPLGHHPPSSVYSQDTNFAAYAPRDPNHAIETPTYYDQQHRTYPHIWQPPPQELPLTTVSTSFPTSALTKARNSMYGDVRGPSELPGDDVRSELDSAGPESPVLGGRWKSGGGGGGGGGRGTQRQGWMAPRDWGLQDMHAKKDISDQELSEERKREGEGDIGVQRLGVLDAIDEEVDGRGGINGRTVEMREVRGRKEEGGFF